MTGSEPGANPYVGPRPFEIGERIFGRERELEELVCLLGAERIMLLHSPSGAGKSSLIQAGLIPRLRERFDVWRPTRVGHPPPDDVSKDSNRYALSAVLGFEQGIPPDRRRGAAALAGLSLAEYVAKRPRRASAPASVLLIFDQFEEVLTVDPLAVAAKQAFFAQLGELLQDPIVWALFSLREDYLAPLDPYAQQVPTHLRNRYRIDLLGLEAAQEAIVQPTADRARKWTEAAAQKLIRDLATVKLQQADGRFVEEVGLHVEPMQLQVVCRGLWDRMPGDDLSIDPEDVDAFGNVTDALGGYYGDELRRIAAGDPRTERQLREWVGEILITADGIRRPVLRTSGASEGLANALIERLVDAHLIRADHRGGAIWYELAHDRLVRPVRLDNERWSQENLQPVQVQAALWARQGKPATLLLSEDALAAAERWASGQTGLLGEPDASFLAASREVWAHQRAIRAAEAQALRSAQELAEAQARAAARQRIFTRVATALAVVSVIAAAGSIWQFREAREQTARAEEAALRARDQSRIAASGAVGDATTEAVLLRELERPAATNLWLQLVTDLRQKPIALAVFDHADRDSSSMFSSDRSQLVVVSADSTVRVLSVDGRAPVRLAGHKGKVFSAAYSSDGARIVTAGEDGTARVWPAAGGEPVVLTGPPGPVVSAIFSSDGSRVLTIAEDGTARVWPAAGGEPVVLTEGAEQVEKVLAGAFSPDGTRVATISEEGTTRVWPLGSDSKPVVRKATRHIQDKPLGASVVFSPDGQRMVTMLAENAVRVWHVEGGLAPELTGHKDVVHGAAFSPDGERIVTVSADKTARVWKTSGDGGEPVVHTHESGVVTAAFSADGSRIVTGTEDGTAHVWSADGSGLPVVLAGHATRVKSAVFSPDGAWVATTSGDRAALWHAAGTGEPLVLTGHNAARTPWAAASLSPDGSRVVFTAEDKTAQVWRTDGVGSPVVLKGHEDEVTGAMFSPDGGRLVTASKDRTARVWQADGAGEPVVLKGHEDEVLTASFSPDGSRVVTATEAAARVWRADGAGEPVVLKAEKVKVRAVWVSPEVRAASFSPDGNRVVVAAEDAARVWRADGTGEPITFDIGEDNINVSAAVFSPDGTRVAAIVSDRTVRVWRLDGVGEPVVLKGHEGEIQVAVFSPDGSRIVTASHDRSARVWRADGTGDPVVLAGHEDKVQSAWFSADGSAVVTASMDRTARVWRADGGGEPLVLTGHKNWVHSAVFLPSAGAGASAVGQGAAEIKLPVFSTAGRRVMTNSEDHTVRIWTLRSPDEYVTYLWQATSYCLPEHQRILRLGETREEAATGLKACQDRVAEYAAQGAYR